MALARRIRIPFYQILLSYHGLLRPFVGQSWYRWTVCPPKSHFNFPLGLPNWPLWCMGCFLPVIVITLMGCSFYCKIVVTLSCCFDWNPCHFCYSVQRGSWRTTRSLGVGTRRWPMGRKRDWIFPRECMMLGIIWSSPSRWHSRRRCSRGRCWSMGIRWARQSNWTLPSMHWSGLLISLSLHIPLTMCCIFR